MRTKKGFSLGEVMVAMFILLIGMADAVFLTANSIRDLGDGRDAMVAASLAQEGVELVRNVRDNTVTESTCGTGSERCTAFATIYGFPSFNNNSDTKKCSIGYDWGTGDDKLMCGGSAKDVLYFNRQKSLFSHSNGEVSKFKRGVYIKYVHSQTPVAADDSDVVATITSVVVYGKDGLPDANKIDAIAQNCLRKNKCVYAQTHLTSWINYGE